MNENSIPCQINGCDFNATHDIKGFGFCCQHYQSGSHDFLHSEISRITGQFSWNIRGYENAISELKNQISEERQERDRQYSNLAVVAHKALSQLAKYKNAKTRRKKAKA